MTADELKKIAAKIAKCLALTASDNPAEAEAAQRQAEALMKKYKLTGDEVAASQVREFAGSEQERQAIKAYKAQRWGDTLANDSRTGATPKNDNDYQALLEGHMAANAVSLHKPVQSKRGALLK